MRARIAALLLTGLAGPSLAQPRVDPANVRQVVIVPVPLADAVGEFEGICLASGFGHDRFDAAIGRSRWRFRTEQGLGTPAPDVRRAPQAIFNFHAPPLQEARTFAPGQCNMEVVMRPAVERDQVYGALQAALSRATGSVPPRHEFPGETCWRWTPTPDRVARLCLMHWPGTRSAHIALSYQLWTPAAERRARLVPPAQAAR